MEREREVGVEEAGRWAGRHDLEFVEVSALTGKNVDEVFYRAATQVLTRLELGEIDPGSGTSGIQFGDARWSTNTIQLSRIGGGRRSSMGSDEWVDNRVQSSWCCM